MLDPETGSGSDSESAPREPTDTRLWEGIRLLAAGRPGSARRHFEKILERVPGHLTARTYLARCYMAEQRVEEAERHLDSVLTSDPDHVAALCAQAECALVAGEEAKAWAGVDRAVRAFHRNMAEGRPGQDDLIELVHLLSAFEDDVALERLARRYVRGSIVHWDGMTLARLGVAAWNVGLRHSARWMWRRAAQDQFLENLMPVFLHLIDVVEYCHVPPFRLDYNLGVNEKLQPDVEPSGSLRAFAVYTVWHGDEPASQEAALDVLAQCEPVWTEAFLHAVILRPELPDPLKLRASGWLLERGFLKANVPLRMHLEGKVRDVTIATAPRPLEPVSEARAGHDARLRARRNGGTGRRVRRTEVHPGMGWEAGLETWLKKDLEQLARTLGVPGISRLRKRELASAVADWLQSNWGEICEGLSREEAGLLTWIAEQGGAVPFARLLEHMHRRPVELVGGRSRGDGNGSLPPEVRLQSLGLLFVGKMEQSGSGEPVAVIPREMRERLVNGRRN